MDRLLLRVDFHHRFRRKPFPAAGVVELMIRWFLFDSTDLCVRGFNWIMTELDQVSGALSGLAGVIWPHDGNGSRRSPLRQGDTLRGLRNHPAARGMIALTVKACVWPVLACIFGLIGLAINTHASALLFLFAPVLLFQFFIMGTRPLSKTFYNAALLTVKLYVFATLGYYLIGSIMWPKFALSPGIRHSLVKTPFLPLLTIAPSVYFIMGLGDYNTPLGQLFLPLVLSFVVAIASIYSFHSCPDHSYFDVMKNHNDRRFWQDEHPYHYIASTIITLYTHSMTHILIYLVIVMYSKSYTSLRTYLAAVWLRSQSWYHPIIPLQPLVFLYISNYGHYVGKMYWYSFTTSQAAIISSFVFLLCFYLANYLSPSKLTDDENRIVTTLLHSNSHQLTINVTSMRADFGTRPCPEVTQHRVHTHGSSAKHRTTSAAFMDVYAQANGMRVFQYSMSKADQRNGRVGSRGWFFAKDVGIDPSYAEPQPTDLFCYVDVDYYVDMNKMLNKYFQPTMLYTLVPEHGANTAADYCYTFDDKGNVHYQVTGGSGYRHRLWDYGHDTLTATYQDDRGVTWTSIYSVDRRKMGDERQLILLLPIRQWCGIYARIANSELEHSLLRRLDCIRNGYAVIRGVTVGTTTVSLAPLGSYTGVTMTQAKYDLLVSAVSATRHELTIGAIQHHLGSPSDSVLVAAYFKGLDGYKPLAAVYPVPDFMNGYSYDLGSAAEPSNYKMERIMPPIYDAALTPASDLKSEQAAIEGRINKVKSKVLRSTIAMERQITEFIEHLIPEEAKHSLIPTDLDYVFEKQDRKTQRSLIERSFIESFKDRIESFLKAETYQKIADPRVISTLPPKVKVHYSRYMYALNGAEFIKKRKWYAFGKKPEEISARVAEVCTKAEHVINTDFSRFDGHYSNLLRDVERRILLRAFKTEHHPELIELHEKQYKMKGSGKFGTKYDTDYTRASGSPETSCFNTLSNAFVAYCALRKKLPSDAAFKGLGIYGGDDGFTADVCSSDYVQAAADVGQVLTSEVVHRGQLGVKFLARVYSPAVWNGVPDSCCDILRQVGKLHLATKVPGLTHKQRVILKAQSFQLSDANTPIIGDFANWVMDHNTDDVKVNHEVAHLVANHNYTEPGQYPNENSNDWMSLVMERDLPLFDYGSFLTWLAAHDLTHLSQMPQFNPQKNHTTTVPVVLRGEILLPESKAETKTEIKQEIPPASAGDNKALVPVEDKKPLSPSARSMPQPQGLDNKAKRKTKPLTGPALERKAKFDKIKAEKQAKGTWIDKPKETFEQMKARKVAAGTWREPRASASK